MDEQLQYDSSSADNADAVFADVADTAADTASREQALAEREAAVAKREMKAAAAERLSKAKLPSGLISCMNFSSQESFEESYKAVCESFSEAIREGMKQRVYAQPPKKSSAGSPDAFLEGLGIIK